MKKIVLEAITGSRAYNLHHAQSDTDKMGVFLSPTVEVAGLYWGQKDESWSDAGPEGDDNTLHEVGKFLRLALKQNPTLIELLFMDTYEVLDEVGQGMVGLRSSIVYTEGIRSAYHGYAKAQLERVRREYPDHKPKMARHCLRISRQANELLRTGEMSVSVPNPQEYFDLSDMTFNKMDDILAKEIAGILETQSVIRETPDTELVKDFLADVRRNYIG